MLFILKFESDLLVSIKMFKKKFECQTYCQNSLESSSSIDVANRAFQYRYFMTTATSIFNYALNSDRPVPH